MDRRRRLILPLLAVAAALAAAVPIVGIAAPNDPVLPDLVADPPQRQIVSTYTYPDGTQALLLRFDGYVHNIGPGPFEIRATGRSGGTMTDVRQYVRTEGGSFVRSEPPPGPPVVLFETEDNHNHWHLKNIARYSLWNPARTAEVAPGMKVGFCLVDSERRETNGPSGAVYTVGGNNFCGQNEPTRSSVTMGVSAGWRDLYHRDLSYQWVDISDTQPGNYWVAAEIDTNNVIKEANEANNSRAFAATQTAVPGYLATAVNAGTLPFGQASTVTLASQTFGSPGARRFRIKSLPAHGTLSSGGTALGLNAVVTGPGITYTPASGYSGPDAFDFTAFSSTSQFPRNPASATVSLTVGQQPTGTQVQISGAPTSMNMGTSVQLTATVTNGTGGVTWSVNGVQGGNSTVGTITPAGLYTAPAAVPDPASVTIRATSVSTPTASDQKSITIVNPGPPDPAPEPPGNLVRNPSFETDTSGWTTWQASVSRVGLPDAPNGVSVARVARTSGTAFTIDDAPETVLSAASGTPYTARAFVKAASTTSVGKRVRIFLREGTPTAYIRTISGPSVVLSNTFQEITGQITAQTAGNELEVLVGMESGAASGDAFYLDQVSFSNGTTPPPPVNNPPTASFTANTTTPAVGQSVTFTDTSTDGDGVIAGRAWDTDGDGQYDDGTGATATASYPAAGQVTVRLRVTDDDAAPATASMAINVQATTPPPNTPPVASFTVSNASPPVGQSVTFSDTSTDPGGSIASRAWDLDGDGQYDDGATSPITRSYATPGAVTVGLRVTDNGNASSTTTRTVTVQATAPPPPPGNLVANGSFETNTTGWTTWQAALARVALAGAPDGAYVARLTRSSGTAFTMDDSPETVLSAVTTGPYVARAWVRAGSTSAVGKRVRLFIREGTPGPTGRYLRMVGGPLVTLSNTWQEITQQLTAQTAGNELEVIIGMESGAASGDVVYVDKVSMSAP
jgi:PKD repeat protein